jgi:uncharacterized protein (DUF697 family)
MTRKPLPKAITRTIANLHGIAADFVSDEQGRIPRQNSSQAAAPYDSVEPEPALAAHRNENIRPPAEPRRTDVRATKRHAAARKIVQRHRNYAALGGLVPLPIVSIASLTAINMRMVKALSDLYGVPFQRDRTRSLLVGIVGGAVPAGLGSATASTLMFVIPGGLLFGLGVSAVTAAALTRGIGQVFVEGFESAATA